MLALLATSAAFAPSPQRLLTATLAGGWQLKLTELDPDTGAATDTLISVDHSKGDCKAPLNAPSLQMDSAIATVAEGLFFLVQCQGIINSTVQSADHYLVVRTGGKADARRPRQDADALGRELEGYRHDDADRPQSDARNGGGQGTRARRSRFSSATGTTMPRAWVPVDQFLLARPSSTKYLRPGKWRDVLQEVVKTATPDTFDGGVLPDAQGRAVPHAPGKSPTSTVVKTGDCSASPAHTDVSTASSPTPSSSARRACRRRRRFFRHRLKRIRAPG